MNHLTDFLGERCACILKRRLCQGLGIFSRDEKIQSTTKRVYIAFGGWLSTELFWWKVCMLTNHSCCAASLLLMGNVEVDKLEDAIASQEQVIGSEIAMHYLRCQRREIAQHFTHLLDDSDQCRGFESLPLLHGPPQGMTIDMLKD